MIPVLAILLAFCLFLFPKYLATSALVPTPKPTAHAINKFCTGKASDNARSGISP